MDTSLEVPCKRGHKRKADEIGSELIFMSREKLRQIIQELHDRKPKKYSGRICHRSLLELRNNYILPQVNRSKSLGSWVMMYNASIKQAVYAHDWEKLLNILLACPTGGQNDQSQPQNIDNYLRAILLLLLHHRNENNASEVNEYLHLVLSCRSEESQACVLKALLSLPKCLPSRNSFKRNFVENDD